MFSAKNREPFMAALAALNPNPKSELNYSTPFELLVAVMLSAQATDKGVNLATAKLFPVANTPQKILDLGLDGLIPYVQTINLYRTKAQHLIEACRILIGRKTANVVMNVAFGEPAIAVDTHIFRVCNRTGFAPGKNPTEVEEKLLKVVPKDYLLNAHHWLLLFGRYICKARNPECVRCPVAEYCSAPEKTEALAKAAEEAADLKPGSPAKKPRAKKKPTLPEAKSNDRSV